MLTELTMRLKSEQSLDFWNSSLLQGVLMEHADPAFAERMHLTGLHPYSQHVFSTKDNGPIWKIKTLDKDSFEGLSKPWLNDDIKSFKLNHKDITIEITEKSLKEIDEGTLLNKFYSSDTERRIKVSFESPTAFKRDSRYVFMPEVGLIFASLMRKYTSSSDGMSMNDQDTLDYLIDHTFISSYRIRSTVFPMEGIKIPSFMGELTFSFNGTDTMARYARLLLEYGEYSGVGIKCGVGMGSIKILRGGNNERQSN